MENILGFLEIIIDTLTRHTVAIRLLYFKDRQHWIECIHQQLYTCRLCAHVSKPEQKYPHLEVPAECRPDGVFIERYLTLRPVGNKIGN